MPLHSLATCLLLASQPSTPPPTLRVSSRFGRRADPLGAGARMHGGIDLPGRPGSRVSAAAAGVVRFAGRRGGYGNLVELDHEDGSRTRYGHLSTFLVRPGDRVARGETIAAMGSTGRSTGNHLHFELLVRGRAVDPISCFGAPPAPTRGAPAPVRLAPLSAEPPHRSAFSLARVQASGEAEVLPGGAQSAAVLP